jgi:pimeloyl-ACP methyl ester carboxylesterase
METASNMSESSVPDFTTVSIAVPRDGRQFTICGITNDTGSNPPDVIWLHANGFNAGTYRSTLATLSPRLKVLAIDQRGHGGTPQDAPTAAKRDALDMRDDLLALLDVVASEHRVILAGHSLGGCVSLLAAAEAPGRVRALALFDPVILARDLAERALTGDWPPISESPLVLKARSRRREFASRREVFESYRGRSIFKTWPEAALRDYIAAGFRDLPSGDVGLTCAPEWESANFAAHGHDIWGAMGRIEAPVRIWRAEEGSTCAIANAAEFPRPAGQVRVETVAGATHFLPIERPELVRDALRKIAATTPA